MTLLHPDTEYGSKVLYAGSLVLGSLAKKPQFIAAFLGRASSGDNERLSEIMGEMGLSPIEKLHGKDDEIMDSVSYVLQDNPKLSQAFDLYVPLPWPGVHRPLCTRALPVSA